MDIAHETGERIRYYRKKKQMTIDQLAAAICKSKSCVSKYENGQIAVDLGEDAEEDPAAVVTLILNGVDITCTVAPAVIFYSVYECGSDDEDAATAAVMACGVTFCSADCTRVERA